MLILSVQELTKILMFDINDWKNAFQTSPILVTYPRSTQEFKLLKHPLSELSCENRMLKRVIIQAINDTKKKKKKLPYCLFRPTNKNHIFKWHVVLIGYALWIQVDKGISSEVVRAVLAERANTPSLAAKSAYKVSDFLQFIIWTSTILFYFFLMKIF